jgi:hypothetical protein
MVKFALKLLLVGLPVIWMTSVNYVVDPNHKVHGWEEGSEEGIADLLIQQKNVTGLPPFNDRKVARLYIEKSYRQQDIIVLGSSRTMEVQSADFRGARFFNHSVLGGTIQDSFSIYDIYSQWHIVPRAVVLDVDASAFNINNTLLQFSAGLLLNSDADIEERLGLKVPLRRSLERELEKGLQLVSPAIFQIAIKEILRRPEIRPHAIAEPNHDQTLLLADGSRRIFSVTSKRSAADVHRDVAAYVTTRPISTLEDYGTLDLSDEAFLDRFVGLLQEDGVRVVLLLIPFHPVAYDVIRNDANYRRVFDAERFVRQMGARQHVIVAGSYDPEIAGCSESDFYDALHAKHGCVEHILATNRIRDRLLDDRWEDAGGAEVDR